MKGDERNQKENRMKMKENERKHKKKRNKIKDVRKKIKGIRKKMKEDKKIFHIQKKNENKNPYHYSTFVHESKFWLTHIKNGKIVKIIPNKESLLLKDMKFKMLNGNVRDEFNRRIKVFSLTELQHNLIKNLFPNRFAFVRKSSLNHSDKVIAQNLFISHLKSSLMVILMSSFVALSTVRMMKKNDTVHTILQDCSCWNHG
jgi:hypothetical protein